MRNRGNTCFAAAAVWAMRSCKRIRYAASIGTSAVERTLARLFDSPGDEGAWESFVKEASDMIGRIGNEPHDSHETLCAVAARSPALERLFAIPCFTTVECEACGSQTRTDDTLAYAVCEPANSLLRGLEASHSPKRVESRRCDSCRRTADARMLCLPKVPAPGVLVVRTTRPDALRIEHEIRYCGHRYSLRAVIVHTGDGASGHYSALVLDGGSRWTACDDDDVRDASLPFRDGASEAPSPSTVLYERAD
jgi:hypothetical protein